MGNERTMRARVSLLIMILACGCGDLRPPDDVPQAFAGDWNGHVVVSLWPEIVREYDASLSVSVAGKVATITGMCPDGTGAVTPFGFDGVLSWSGSVECAPSWIIGCAVRLEYTSATVTLADGDLVLHAAGNAHRSPITDMTCAGSDPFTMDFTGAH